VPKIGYLVINSKIAKRWRLRP